MDVAVTTTRAIRRAKLQSNCQRQQINTQFLTGRMPFPSPNQQCQGTEGISGISRYKRNFLSLVTVAMMIKNY